MDGRLTDEGLESLRGLSRWGVLKLEEHRGITNAGLAHLSELTRLGCLDLKSTSLSDAGLVHFRALKGLGSLVVSWTAVTEAGARLRSEPLPKATIFVS